jgi:renalase
MVDVAVIGGGIAGLACARALADRGADVVVLDKARGVGGRCATRRLALDGIEVGLDHGLAFYPATDPEFGAVLREVPGAVEGWPHRIVGSGPPCQPDALLPVFPRVAFRGGASAVPKHLARGLAVRTGARVVGIEVSDGARLTLESGDAVTARRLVVALPVEQALALPLHAPAARAGLGFFSSRSCLAVLGLWPVSGDLGFDVMRPGGSVAHVADETTKGRPVPPGTRALVIQASARFSATHLEDPPEIWGPLLLAACVPFLGEWVRTPRVAEYHRWRYARIDPGFGLAGPLLAGNVGWCGEAFDPAGGVQGAWRSARVLAERLAG